VRVDGYAPIREYAAIGDGRSVALVASDGSIDWLCLPNLDSGSAFGALLDARRGGRFELAPAVPFESERRYLPDTNVLETTFRTAGGTVRVTDAMTVAGAGLAPFRELVRRVEGVAGAVPMRWRAEPRFSYGRRPVSLGRRHGVPVATSAHDAVAVRSWDAGEPEVGDDAIAGAFEARAGGRALLVLAAAHQEPLVLPVRNEVEARLAATAAFWRQWVSARGYAGPWREAVVRSALALKLLTFAPSGAIAAAPTTSLPEQIGGSRNWDYRFSWVRDASYTVDALLELACPAEGESFFWWLMHAARLTHPRLSVLYCLDGRIDAKERELPLEGYRRSRPVRLGNGAVEQLQLDIYGGLLEAAYVYASAGNRLDRDTGRRLGEYADLVCELWRCKDAGLWEVRSAPEHFTQSKLMCWIALDRACRLAERGEVRGGQPARWRKEADAILAFVDERCWSEEKGGYTRSAGREDLDAGFLLAFIRGFGDAADERIRRTVEAIRRELAHGPFVHRYRDEDGLPGDEGAFVACSFWLVDALARIGRQDDAAALMEEVLALANDVGLYSEEIDPADASFLGNFPQALSHLALIEAAVQVAT
jgi:GH15 family glucan-1,4-alpha-glucosidase